MQKALNQHLSGSFLPSRLYIFLTLARQDVIMKVLEAVHSVSVYVCFNFLLALFSYT